MKTTGQMCPVIKTFLGPQSGRHCLNRSRNINPHYHANYNSNEIRTLRICMKLSTLRQGYASIIVHRENE